MDGTESEQNPKSSAGKLKRNSMYLEKCKSPKVACFKISQPGHRTAYTELEPVKQETTINFQTTQEDGELGELPNELNLENEDNFLNL